ncbi:geranylgeranyl diphosphate synthase type I [Nocardia transvalensis]|uniref:Geranylgeranyl diphosphate synthase type I n=1 Tax=Nocardia transvalensis TaxID=37333 RepID=A0A7W9ULD0_9NOCA|nr:polyprenyl synthetase family protein [Nocardia transvalensis]MBB5917419.1 geranylgeranyl diphosphate synthase type I [Nocardia transvalensis]
MSTADRRNPAPESLATTRRLIDPPMRAAVDRMPEPMRRIAGYHLGWVDEYGADTGDGGGKAVRPALTLLAARSVGGDPAAAIVPAASIELAHNYTLIHDDAMDGDRTRRHRPTAWSVFGRWQAILTGDAMLAQALNLLATQQLSRAAQSTQLLTSALLALHQGQSTDLGLEHRTEVSLAEVTAMVYGKTGALLACACEIGALYGEGTPEQVKSLRQFGEHLGMAFQLVDDILGIWGDPASTGKSVHSDLVARKKSLPVTAALVSGTAAGAELADFYHGDGPLTTGELERAAELIVLAGGRDWARRQARHEFDQGVGHLMEATASEDHAAGLLDLARLIIDRDH